MPRGIYPRKKTAEPTAEPKKRGRPPGSKPKVGLIIPHEEAVSAAMDTMGLILAGLHIYSKLRDLTPAQRRSVMESVRRALTAIDETGEPAP